MRVGMLGGTFDPVHLGHLIGAQAAAEQLELDKVLFVPAAQPPHKSSVPISEAGHRVAMLELALTDNDLFGIYLDEIERGGASYTVDTIRRFKDLSGGADEVFFILGADNLAEFTTWKDWQGICREARLVSLKREGSNSGCYRVPEQLQQVEIAWVEMPLIGISATDIRIRCAAGKSIRYRVPDTVAGYIGAHGLYGRSKC
ncbi:MAG: nicotinate-nucleotide adenylyltransferase [Candidatus Glassbacteria bacterium]|nr:nicotinate-nucleotide adenylyltransferase [Candidatus Glassbacteria bacterium]